MNSPGSLRRPPARAPGELHRPDAWSNLVKPCHRMKRSRDFERLRREGRTHAGRFVVLSTLHEPSSATPFLAGFITSKKIGIAVVRNRVRRRLRAIVDECAHRIRPGTLLVTIARFRAADARYAALRQDWLQQARRAGILTPD